MLGPSLRMKKRKDGSTPWGANSEDLNQSEHQHSLYARIQKVFFRGVLINSDIIFVDNQGREDPNTTKSGPS